MKESKGPRDRKEEAWINFRFGSILILWAVTFQAWVSSTFRRESTTYITRLLEDWIRQIYKVPGTGQILMKCHAPSHPVLTEVPLFSSFEESLSSGKQRSLIILITNTQRLQLWREASQVWGAAGLVTLLPFGSRVAIPLGNLLAAALPGVCWPKPTDSVVSLRSNSN